MKAVTSAFDKDTDSQEKLEAQTRILNEQIKVQEQRVELLQKGVEAAADEFGKGATETLKWEQALNEAKSTLNGLKSNLSNLENGVEDVTEELKDGEQASFGFGDALKSDLLSGTIIEGVKGLAGSLSDLTENTKEYRKIMASLDISSENAGYTAKETTEIYKTLYGVLGDNQTAATTTANLQAIGLEQEQLTEITNGAIGAWATYGDSIPIDSLAESINETIQAGTVTGAFADVLNWAGTSEDDFNKKLSEAKDSTERANIVLDELAKQGLPDAGKAWQDANDDIVDANKATSDFEDITADLSKKFSPISTSLQEGFNEIAEAALDMVDDSDIDEFSDIIADVADFIADEVMPIIKNLFDFIIDNKDTILRVVEGIGAGFATWKAGSVVADIAGNLKKFASNATNASGPMAILNGLWKENPVALVATSVGLLVEYFGYLNDFINKFVDQSQPYRAELENQQEILDGLKESYSDVKDAAWETANAELSHVDYVKDLYAELQTLAGENGKVSDKDRERAQFILTELNEALGTEYTMTGNQIEQYKTMQSEIDNLIEKKRASIMLEAYEQEYKAAVENNQKAQAEWAKAFAAYTEQNQKVHEEYSDLLAMTGDELAEYMWQGNQERVAQFTSEKLLLKDMEETYQAYSDEIGMYNNTISTYEAASAAALEGNTEKVIDLLGQQAQASSLVADKDFESTEQRKYYWSNMYRELKSAQDYYYEQLAAGNKVLTDEQLKTLEEFTKSAKEEMEKAGVEATDEFSSTALENIGVVSESMRRASENMGKNTSQGFSNGINENMGLVISAGQNLANKLISVVKNNLGIRSPSRVMKELGQYTGEGFEIGVIDSMKSALSTLQQDLDTSAVMLSNVQPFSVPVGFGNPAFVSSNGRSISYGDFSVVVNAAPGMDENALADAVAYKLQTQVMQKEAVFR